MHKDAFCAGPRSKHTKNIHSVAPCSEDEEMMIEEKGGGDKGIKVFLSVIITMRLLTQSHEGY